MNAKKIIVLSGLMLVFLSLSSFQSGSALNETIVNVDTQDGFIVYATYNGKTDANYNFIVKDRKGVEQVFTFQKIDASVLTAFDLNTETFVGTMFKVTFNKGDDGSSTLAKLETLPSH